VKHSSHVPKCINAVHLVKIWCYTAQCTTRLSRSHGLMAKPPLPKPSKTPVELPGEDRGNDPSPDLKWERGRDSRLIQYVIWLFLTSKRQPVVSKVTRTALVPARDVFVTAMQRYRANLITWHHYQPAAVTMSWMSVNTQAGHGTAVVKHWNHLNHMRLNLKAPSVDSLQNSAIICNIQSMHELKASFSECVAKCNFVFKTHLSNTEWTPM